MATTSIENDKYRVQVTVQDIPDIICNVTQESKEYTIIVNGNLLI